MKDFTRDRWVVQCFSRFVRWNCPCGLSLGQGVQWNLTEPNNPLSSTDGGGRCAKSVLAKSPPRSLQDVMNQGRIGLQHFLRKVFSFLQKNAWLGICSKIAQIHMQALLQLRETFASTIEVGAVKSVP